MIYPDGTIIYTPYPDYEVTEKSSTGEIIFWYFGVPFIVVGGTFVVAELSAAIPAAIGAGGATCGDGDRTNEIAAVVRYAQNLQGKDRYPGVDKFAEATIKQGELLIGAAEKHGRTAFYTTIDSLIRFGRSAEVLWKGLQVAPDEVYGYRQAITVYRAIGDIPVAVGQALANPQYGRGGYTQIVIEGFQDFLEPIISVLLK